MERQLAAARGEGPAPERAPDDVSNPYFCHCLGCVMAAFVPALPTTLFPLTGKLAAAQCYAHDCVELSFWVGCCQAGFKMFDLE